MSFTFQVIAKIVKVRKQELGPVDRVAPEHSLHPCATDLEFESDTYVEDLGTTLF